MNTILTKWQGIKRPYVLTNGLIGDRFHDAETALKKAVKDAGSRVSRGVSPASYGRQGDHTLCP